MYCDQENSASLRIQFSMIIFFFALVSLVHIAQADQAEWEKTLSAAKKEGRVNVYIKTGYDAALRTFQKRYPEIKLVSVAGQTRHITQRLLVERRAGKHIADVYSAGVRSVNDLRKSGALAPIRPAIMLPEVADATKWRGGPFYPDPEERYIFTYLSVVQQGGVHYNSKKINPKDFKSFWDFVDTKRKGKLMARDIRSPGPGNGAMLFFYHNPKLGPKFIRRLFEEMDLTLFRDTRQGTDWLAAGKFPICFFCSRVGVAKMQGLPVDSFQTEGWGEGSGIVSHSGNLVLMKNAPHPNAAKIFINWLLSREGQSKLQQVLRDVQDAESRRIDISKDIVLPEVRWKEGNDYIELDRTSDMKPIYKIVNRALAQAKRK